MDWKVTLDNTFSDCLNKRNVVGLVLFWLTGVVLVAVYAGLSRRSESEAVPLQGQVPGLERNETGALTAWREDSSCGAQPAYKIAFDNLRAENGNLGVFKTASLKVVYVENVRAVFSADGSPDGANVELSDFHALFAPRRNGASSANPLGLFSEMEGSSADWSVPVDMANTTEVRIRQLDWRVCQGDRTVFRVQCQHATLRSDTPRMVLRGHVTVTTSEAVLESNCVQMNAKDESIVVPGRYSLKCDGTMRVGLGERFSKALKPADGGPSDTEGDREWANGFQPGSF
jgi:hypothetical protein